MVQGIEHIDFSIGKVTQNQPVRHVSGDDKSFGDMLKQAIEKVSTLEKDSHTKQIAFANGENIELHEVVIAMEKYSIALELMLSVRNKVIEAYQEISRMNI